MLKMGNRLATSILKPGRLFHATSNRDALDNARQTLGAVRSRLFGHYLGHLGEGDDSSDHAREGKARSSQGKSPHEH